MVHARTSASSVALYEERDGDALLDVEHVLVYPAVRGLLVLLDVAVQVENVDLIERAHQRLAHAAERWVVEVAVVGDETQHALAGALDPPLGEADELHVIVAQPLRLSGLLQFGDARFVVRGQVPDPLALVRRVPGVGRVADHDHHRAVSLHRVGLARFACDLGSEHHLCGLAVRLLQRVGQEDVETPVRRPRELERVAADFECEFEVSDGVGSHQELEAEQAREQMLLHVVRPGAAQSTLFQVGADHSDDLAQKRAGAGGGIEDQHAGAAPRLAVLGLGLDCAGVGESVGQTELAAQQQVDAADDVRNDGFGRVEDAVLDFQLLVVGGEEVLVEVDRWVFAFGALAEVFEDCRHVGAAQQPRQIVDDPGDSRIGGRPCDAAENIAQEWRGLRERRGLAIERLRRAVIEPARGEEAVGDGLSL